LKDYHLEKLGIESKMLVIDYAKLKASVGSMAQKTKEEIGLLKNQLLEIYAQVYMDVSCVNSMIKTALMLKILLCRIILGHA
jgi:hypothetical protein